MQKPTGTATSRVLDRSRRSSWWLLGTSPRPSTSTSTRTCTSTVTATGTVTGCTTVTRCTALLRSLIATAAEEDLGAREAKVQHGELVAASDESLLLERDLRQLVAVLLARLCGALAHDVQLLGLARELATDAVPPVQRLEFLRWATRGDMEQDRARSAVAGVGHACAA